MILLAFFTYAFASELKVGKISEAIWFEIGMGNYSRILAIPNEKFIKFARAVKSLW